MRPIHIAELGAKPRPVLVLTREVARPVLNTVTVAPITSTIRGIPTEVRLDSSNGLDHDCVALLDKITTLPATALGRRVGSLHPGQEESLTDAIHAAFELK
ncbi:type II toxin-antitoxin system PemK/MazF family toxin [Nocardia otitidiscaviarum]|uniref:mRNA interferase MazF3 n=1 Tax=Nocardia otitidiscaviarum TaxID=1823 RepID=A0A378YUE4_9NOCA|nr:type II toxin-antitoxin system PemK/MazF family toxin [Nocardia otitidiscaviarum]MBF6135041.1 type II toxin-antitoxin system PemK/MazF family toxin [Nocardia otitidiscaviarum]MBF6181308.1 type II toxin-antitoxin system PemK/MazF family toxin [Nocardia otitidiscaviarum]MBF6486864.1 type II toxin-antitoxin system PemK/MazF family toxin [Nocardia otitidiscaviarum]SUA80160.1 mRNA interferase MazF3 [Nocardia otitidiscaviarum]